MDQGAPNPLMMFVEEMKARTPEKRQITLLGNTFWQYPTVFDSEFAEEGCEFFTVEVLKLVAEEVAKNSSAESFDFLEVGCGTGHTSIMVAQYDDKCQVWASDINPNAIENTSENAKLHGVSNQVKAAIGDVFDASEMAGKKFNIIFWSHPFVPFSGKPNHCEVPELGLCERGLVDPEYRGLRDYLEGAKAFLKTPASKLLLGFSYKIGSEDMLKEVLAETGWDCKEIARAEVELKFSIKPMSMKTDLVFLELIGGH